jgi:hypothetical protein
VLTEGGKERIDGAGITELTQSASGRDPHVNSLAIERANERLDGSGIADMPERRRRGALHA